MDGRRRSGLVLQLENRTDVIDVRVRADDLLQPETMSVQAGKNKARIVSRVDDHRFSCGFIAHDGAVALKQSDGEGLDDHGLTLVAPRTVRLPVVAPGLLLMSVLAVSCSSPGSSFCRMIIRSVSRTFPSLSL